MSGIEITRRELTSAELRAAAGEQGCDAGAALSCDLAPGGGAQLRRGGGADRVRAAVGGGTCRAVQPLWPVLARASHVTPLVRVTLASAAGQRGCAEDPDAGHSGDAARAGEDATRRRRGLDREDGGAGDRDGARAGAGGGTARLGGTARDRLDDPAPASPACAGGAAVCVQKSLPRPSPGKPSAIPA